ncbi:2-oxoacid:acceptor oxidoreductase subunit alpha [Acetonema longum]|uniref:Pyruvate flavodoxin/ferredoxin oxidoreductase domain protein n=1 Tax=Acetonema longum DSM 6540 TaxID=1009370 RepID=F7NKR3_9FIRM|nr:2-oxoacid:acceptor oxidoreductase subunit alpha [Acetonema longum]EGO63367.1 pyruvate flavodoxin/ferredoxin oxidoreductase domain protein [Acetonema longum DSM 6540]
MKSDFSCLFAGEAGYGVMSAGSTVAKAAGRNNLWAFVVNEYPSLIKGGLNTCLVRLAAAPLQAHEEAIDCLAVLSQEGLEQNYSRLQPGGCLIADVSLAVDSSRLAEGVRVYQQPLLQKGSGDVAKIMSNSAMLGAFCAVSGFPVDLIEAVLAGEFKPEVFEKNRLLLRAAYETASQQTAAAAFSLPFAPPPAKRMLLNGNDAIAMGALQAGCKFSAGYPMTPGSSVLTYLADNGPAFGLVFKQAEDEIAAINMLIGAGFAGVRAIGSTSGGGFALMAEALGFAALAEVPLVMVNAQRGGPSTGQPTRTAQADLAFVLNASQGEFLRIVVAPGDIEECFQETFRAFNLAEKYQLPVIILTDKYLADSAATHPFFQTEGLAVERGKLADAAWLAAHQPYKRYEFTPDGVSARALPGTGGGRHIATSYTHGEDGFYSSGNREYAGCEPEVTVRALDKLFAKEPPILEELEAVRLYGPETADLTMVVWGSTKGAALEAMELAKGAGISVNVLQVLYLSPFPAAAVAEILGRSTQTLLVEGNKTAQLGGLVRMHTGIHLANRYLKYDSRAFTPSQILLKIKEVLA